jgi:hypothetical protein
MPDLQLLPQASPMKSAALRPGKAELLPRSAFYAALGQVIRTHRRRFSWTNRELADRIKGAASTICRAEKGESLTMPLICALAWEFSMNPAEILREAAAIAKARQEPALSVNRG